MAEINPQGKAEALALGITETIIKTFPELQAIFDMFAAGNIAAARLAYFDSNYYKNLTNNAQSRQAKKSTQPGVYAQEYDTWLQGQKVRLTQKGFRVTPEIEALMEKSYLKGDTDLQLEITILNSGKLGAVGGSTLGAVNALKEYAANQGISQVLSNTYWQKQTEALLMGKTTSADIEQEINDMAISAYPAYAKGIQEGRSFALQTSALKQTVANLLERDVDTITNDDPVFKQLIGYMNPKTQQQEVIPLWKAEEIVKSSEEWLYTNNARTSFDNIGLKVLRDWGIA